MATIGFTNQYTAQNSIEPTRERTIEEVLSEACHALANTIQLLDGMESAVAPARDTPPMPVGVVATALFLHAGLGDLHARVVRLSERLGHL